MLTQYDWSVIVEYMVVLKPLIIATKKLEGNAKEGEFVSYLLHYPPYHQQVIIGYYGRHYQYSNHFYTILKARHLNMRV